MRGYVIDEGLLRGGSITGENLATPVSREGENICKGLEPDARKKNEKIEISETERPLEEKRLEGKILEDDKRPVEGGERLEGMAKVKSNGNCNGNGTGNIQVFHNCNIPVIV